MMDSVAFIESTARCGTQPLKTIETHTCGEPTRIVYEGYPELQGTLLQQRAEAQRNHDKLRKALLSEPRGHREMYGAVLVPKTELREAAIGVLFLTNDGYSTMCGHATIAIARLAIDSLPSGFLNKFLDRNKLKYDEEKQEMIIPLHVPCGLVQAVVPCSQSKSRNNGLIVDQSRLISYLSVPSYAAALNINIPIPQELRWPQLGQRDHITADVAYGGAFYVVCTAEELGFSASLATPDIEGLTKATRTIKKAFDVSEELRKYLDHPDHMDLQFLYGTIVTDPNNGARIGVSAGAESSICFFSDAQVDRSPTGSGVQARVALAYAKGKRKIGEEWSYHSPVSNAFGEGGFVGSAIEAVEFNGREAVIVRVSGFAKYTGAATYVIEEDDTIGEGFWFDGLSASQRETYGKGN